jgi:hypothetical protein
LRHNWPSLLESESRSRGQNFLGLLSVAVKLRL